MVSEPGSSEPELKLPQMEIILGGKGVWRGLTNLTPNLLVQEKFHIRLQEYGVKSLAPRCFELIVQDGVHELKEKEVGDDPDSQFQQQSWPVSRNAKGINLVHCYLRDDKQFFIDHPGAVPITTHQYVKAVFD
ncbi:hypothetical protein DY000_02025288 [Brassica cretica]|uniref:Uncharacterized protein n=1 Tax=Brassica cretica TaxID=69181 RepID=A0ABQ7E8M1_BRACR|nr:hypothetical protein DY000_02025288 [Brassica cretica]